jgi:hypothetical protein
MTRIVKISLLYVFIWLAPVGKLLAPQDAHPQDFTSPAFVKLLSDLPELRAVLKPRDVVWNWINRRLLNTNGSKVYFTDKYTFSDDWASVSYTSRRGNWFIAIRENDKSNRPYSSEKILARVVYELYNLENQNEFNELDVKVIQKQVTCDDYILKNAELEFQAVRKEDLFYINIYLPYAIKNNFPHDEDNWNSQLASNYNQLLGNPDYVNYYKRGYQSVIADSKDEVFFIHQLDPLSNTVRTIKIYPSS